MDYNSIRISLDFINSSFRQQTKIQNLHRGWNTLNHSISLVNNEENNIEVYCVYDFHIASQLNLFDANSLNNEVFNALRSDKNEQIKIGLWALLTIAEENIKLYGILRKIKYGDGTPNDFYNGIKVYNISPAPFLRINGLDDVSIINEPIFKMRDDYDTFNINYYTIFDFLDYSLKYYKLVNDFLDDWNKERKIKSEAIITQNEANRISKSTNIYIAVFTTIAGLWYLHDLIDKIASNELSDEQTLLVTSITLIIFIIIMACIVFRTSIKMKNNKKSNSVKKL